MAPIHFGILMIPYQTVDVAMPTDVLSSSSKELLKSVAPSMPEVAHLVDQSVDIEFHHINETMKPVELTSKFTILPTTTIVNCPSLDYLLVGGPDFTTYHLPESFKEFIRAHVKAGKVLFTTCTGAITVAESGVLDGKKATVNHVFIDTAKQIHPKCELDKGVAMGGGWELLDC